MFLKLVCVAILFTSVQIQTFGIYIPGRLQRVALRRLYENSEGIKPERYDLRSKINSNYLEEVPSNRVQSSRDVDLTDLELEDHYKVRQRRESDDDDDDEGGFVNAPGHTNGDDFLGNVENCPAGETRAPWGKCITCAEFKAKLNKAGPGCPN